MTEERSADVIIQIAKPVLEQKKLYLITKRAFDIVCSFLGLLILAIPMIIIALIITLDSPGLEHRFKIVVSIFPLANYI